MSTDWWTELKSITLHVDGDPPPLWAPGASDEYRTARLALVEAEVRLRDAIEAVAAQRRALPPGPVVPNYQLTEGPLDLSADGPYTPVTLTKLFGAHHELIVYHIMFHPEDDADCAACSMFVDGLHGVSHHIVRRAGLAVVGKAPVDRLRAWARQRGWQGLRVASAFDTSFTTDLGTEGSRGAQFPCFSVFTRHGTELRQAYIASADFPDGSPRGIDLMSPVWNVFDLLPSGRGQAEVDQLRPGSRRGADIRGGGAIPERCQRRR